MFSKDEQKLSDIKNNLRKWQIYPETACDNSMAPPSQKAIEVAFSILEKFKEIPDFIVPG